MSGLRTRLISSRDGKRIRTTIWDAAPGTPSRGVCILLNGQTEFLEKYEEVAQELCSRGFTVAALDWRGQGLSDRLVTDPLKVHVDAFADYDADLSAFLDQIVKPLTDKPPLALAHSMGGHILMRTLHDRPGAIRAAIAIAPMMKVLTHGYPPPVARALCYAENLVGRQKEWVFGVAERDPLKLTFEDNLVTSDRARFARNSRLIAAEPDLRRAGPTWGWLEAAYRSMKQVSSQGYPEAIETPLLIVGAGRDRIVDTSAARAFASRVPNGTYIEIADAEHEILMENDLIRARFWAAFDTFVGRHA